MTICTLWRRMGHRPLLLGPAETRASQALAELDARLLVLRGAGMKSGDTVVCAERPSIDFFFWLAALVEAGVHFAPLSPHIPSEHLQRAAQRLGAQWRLQGAPLRLIRLERSGSPFRPCGDGFRVLLQTSGTTGSPKYVGLDWPRLQAHAFAAAKLLHLKEDDRWAACLPVHHIGGLSVLFRTMILGSCAFVTSAMRPEELNAQIDAETITHCSVVPTMLKRLLDARGDRPFPAALRLLLVGGAALPESLAARARRLEAPVAPTYGMTETASQICTLPPERFLAGASGCGGPLPGLDVQIDGGEICVRGPTVMNGYLDAEPVHDWFRTGDLGEFRDGSLHLFDRRTDLIVSGGENVYPSEVEEVIRRFTGYECAVVGLPDELWGQRVAAAVETDRLDETALHAYCRANLLPHQVPKAYYALQALPRTESGKAKREGVRALLRELV